MPLPNGMKVVPKKGESKAQAKARLEAKYGGAAESLPTSGVPRSTPRPARKNRGAGGPQPPVGGADVIGGREQPSIANQTSPYGAIVQRSFYENERYQIVVQPQAESHALDGAVTTTQYGANAFRPSRTVVTGIEVPLARWDTFKNGAVANVFVDNVAGTIPTYFSDLTQIQNFKGRFSSQQLLATAADFSTYLNKLMEAFSIFRAMEACLASLSLNQVFKRIGSAIGQSGVYDRVQFGLERLMKLPLPPGLIQLFDSMFGVFGLTNDDMWYVAYVNSLASTVSVTDLTSAAALQTLLTQAETQLNAVDGVTAESPIINQLFAMVYGPPKPLPPKQPSMIPGEYDQWFMVCGQVRDTTANLTYVVPILNIAGGVIPVPQRYGADFPRLSSLLRPQLYSSGPTGNASPQSYGLCCWPGNVGTFGRNYLDDGTSSIITNGVPTASLTPFNPVVDGFSFFWTEVAVVGGTGLWPSDKRRYERWNEFYWDEGRISTATRKALDQIFLTGTSISTLR